MTTLTIELPESLTRQLEVTGISLPQLNQVMAQLIQLYLQNLQIREFVTLVTSLPTHEWQQQWATLCEQIQRENQLPFSPDPDEMMEQLHYLRQEIFEAEYAHLY